MKPSEALLALRDRIRRIVGQVLWEQCQYECKEGQRTHMISAIEQLRLIPMIMIVSYLLMRR